jgi:hypothetical protein
MKFFGLALMPLLFVACASKEKTEVKNPLEYLNGKTYGVQGEAPAPKKSITTSHPMTHNRRKKQSGTFPPDLKLFKKKISWRSLL